jgi:hypothetical protein
VRYKALRVCGLRVSLWDSIVRHRLGVPMNGVDKARNGLPVRGFGGTHKARNSYDQCWNASETRRLECLLDAGEAAGLRGMLAKERTRDKSL